MNNIQLFYSLDKWLEKVKEKGFITELCECVPACYRNMWCETYTAKNDNEIVGKFKKKLNYGYLNDN